MQALYTPELADYTELELFDFRDYDSRGEVNSRYPWLIYSATHNKGVCWCESETAATHLLLRSGYFRRRLISGGVCWYRK